MRSNILLSKTLLPADTIELGSLIVNVQDPLQDSFTSVNPPSDSSVMRCETLDFSHFQKQNNSDAFESFLTRVITAGWEKQSKGAVAISSLKETTYLLRNSDAHFTAVIATPEARKWVNAAMDRGRNIYFVTGYRTVVDATVAMSNEFYKGRIGGLAVPVAEIVTASTGIPVLPGSDLLDIGFTTEKGEGKTSRTTFMAPGERVFALQVRKMVFRWYSRKQVERGFLEAANRWQVVAVRGREDDGEWLDVSLAEGCDWKIPPENPWDSSEKGDILTGDDEEFLIPE